MKKFDSKAKPAAQVVGIDDISVYVPRLYLPLVGEFSRQRGIDPGKLLKGIGIEKMAVADAHEDAATMAANALLDLMRRSGLRPEDIDKIYVGTESAPDEAKALGTYVIGMMEQLYGKGSFHKCETVEFKAACIGTTFALESLCYWAAFQDRMEDGGAEVDLEREKAGVVIASDIARYPLSSSGEYTQGAGSVALLVKRDPRLLAIEQVWGHSQETKMTSSGLWDARPPWSTESTAISAIWMQYRGPSTHLLQGPGGEALSARLRAAA